MFKNIYLLLITFVSCYGQNISIKNYEIYPNSILNTTYNTIIKSYNTDINNCSLECFNENNCQSFNYLYQNTSNPECQLLLKSYDSKFLVLNNHSIYFQKINTNIIADNCGALVILILFLTLIFIFVLYICYRYRHTSGYTSI